MAYQLGGYSSSSHFIQYLNGTLPIKQPFELYSFRVDMMFLAVPSAIPLKPMEIYALVNIQKAIEAMAEIVDLPNLNLMIFHSYVCLP
jgi:hypothetical protein